MESDKHNKERKKAWNAFVFCRWLIKAVLVFVTTFILQLQERGIGICSKTPTPDNSDCPLIFTSKERAKLKNRITLKLKITQDVHQDHVFICPECCNYRPDFTGDRVLLQFTSRRENFWKKKGTVKARKNLTWKL